MKEPGLLRIMVYGLVLLLGPLAQAARNASVSVSRAIIWADAERSSPLGYVRQGKLLRVGEVERHKGQVVPVIVSGRIGYVALQDISFVQEVNEERPMYTRFQQATLKRYGEQMVFGANAFNATENRNKPAGRNGEDWAFRGFFLKGLVPTSKPNWELGVMFEYRFTSKGKESFRVFDFAVGGAKSLINKHRFKLKLEGWGVIVPWGQYQSDPLFTLNGWGLGVMGQLTASGFFNDHWGVEAAGGYEVMQLFGIKPPKPFKEFNPRFMGPRASVALVYRF